MHRTRHAQPKEAEQRRRRTSWRAFALVLVWVSAGLWDVAHALEHARELHAHDVESAVASSDALSLTLEATHGHGHTHPPEEPPVLGIGKGPDFDAPPIRAAEPLFVAARRPGPRPSPEAVASSRRASASVAGPRAPPLS